MQEELMATLISVYPFEINENKPGVYPGTFRIPAAKDKVQSLIIGEAIHFVDRIDQPPMRIKILPHDLAQSIINDLRESMMGVLPEEGIYPGIFWVPGAHRNDTIEMLYSKELEKARASQRRWFENLVRIADDDWSRYHLHVVISDIQRFAAKTLNLQRDWIVEAGEAPLVHTNCPACQSVINSQAIVCPQCRAVLNKEKYSQFMFAEK